MLLILARESFIANLTKSEITFMKYHNMYFDIHFITSLKLVARKSACILHVIINVSIAYSVCLNTI